MASIINSIAGGKVVSTTLRLPDELLKEVKIQAIREGRSFNTHVAMILKMAAGEDLGGHAPAAGKAQQVNQQEAQHHAAE